jgi:hypothetical protein
VLSRCSTYACIACRAAQLLHDTHALGLLPLAFAAIAFAMLMLQQQLWRGLISPCVVLAAVYYGVYCCSALCIMLVNGMPGVKGGMC